MSEDQLQAQFYQTVWNSYPQLRKHIWAIPNGGKRNPVEAMKLKATGMTSGVWDLHVFWKGKFYIIETKVGRNDLSPQQKEWGELMERHGAKSFVYRNMEEGLKIIEFILNN